MTDIVSYKPPYGLLGSLANELLIKNKLNEIFNYRTQALEKILENGQKNETSAA
jgi:ligand-binding SRPBCC domain-containing protein